MKLEISLGDVFVEWCLFKEVMYRVVMKVKKEVKLCVFWK